MRYNDVYPFSIMYTKEHYDQARTVAKLKAVPFDFESFAQWKEILMKRERNRRRKERHK